jgi:magnesium-transporting ATPase (P-type)
MLTGDHKKTAESIAKAVGILPAGLSDASYASLVFEASDFDRFRDEDLDRMELPLVVARCR